MSDITILCSKLKKKYAEIKNKNQIDLGLLKNRIKIHERLIVLGGQICWENNNKNPKIVKILGEKKNRTENPATSIAISCEHFYRPYYRTNGFIHEKINEFLIANNLMNGLMSLAQEISANCTR